MDHYLFIITILFFVIFSISLVYGLENIIITAFNKIQISQLQIKC
jgi:hypothetical protein